MVFAILSGLMKYALVLCLLASLTLALPAKTFAGENSFLLPTGQIIETDFLRAAENVQIDGHITGDAFLAGGMVTINGKIDGDLFIAGGKVNVNGEVGNNVRIFGGDVTLNGPVGRNVLVVAGNSTVTKRATISGSLLAAGGNMELSAGKVGKGFRFFGGRLFLNTEIANEAYVVAEQEFLLGSSASVTGNLKYTGSKEAVLEKGATVAGSILYQKTIQDESYPRFFGARTALSAYRKIKPLTDFFGFVVMALVGYILLGLFPKIFEKTAMAMEKRLLASLGWGVIVSVMIPTVAVLLTLTILGIPVAILISFLAVVAYFLAQYFAAFFLGRKILLNYSGERRGWALVLGLFLIYLIGLIPVIGALFKAIAAIFALGALVIANRQPEIVVVKPLPFRKASRR